MQLKLYHWQTDDYSRHKASDKFGQMIARLIDEFIETYQGKYGDIYLKNGNKTINIDNIDDKAIIKYLENCRDFLIKDIPTILHEDDTDLYNIRDEMLQLVNTTLYLFTLN